MADGKFKIAGSTTGNYYVMKNGKRTYFDAHNKPMDENVFLKAENATIDRNNSNMLMQNQTLLNNIIQVQKLVDIILLILKPDKKLIMRLMVIQ